MKRLFLFLSLILCLSFPAFAQQRPLLTEDVDTTPEGSFEIAAGVDFLQNAKFPLSGLRGDQTRLGDVRVKVGFSSNVEFQVEGVLQNFLAVNSASAPSPIPLKITGNSTNDVGEFTISTKIKLRNETENLPAIGFKIGLELPNTNQTRGIGINQTNVFGKVLVQKRFGRRSGKDARLNVFGNLGIGILTVPLENFSQNDVLLYGLAAIYRVNDRVNIVSEVNGRANTRSGNAPLGTESLSQFRIGTQIKASNLRFDSAAIFGLTRFSPRTGVIFGITYLSPKIFTPAK
jgi:hypothetical protein